MCTSSTNITIGARGQDHIEPANYSIRKVVFYDRYLSDAEVSKNWNLYKSKIGE